MIEKIVTKSVVASVLLAALTIAPSFAAAKAKTALIIDHNCTAINKVPAEYIEKAKKNLQGCLRTYFTR